jgi:tetratricopeptide (TPR) repeat protein
MPRSSDTVRARPVKPGEGAAQDSARAGLRERPRSPRRDAPAGSGGGSWGSRSQRVTLWAAILCCIPLSARTFAYNRAWTSELNLWSAAVATDPTSASNLAEYGRVLIGAGRGQEARAALDRALSIYPIVIGYLQRADLAVAEKRYADAEADLKLVLDSYPDNSAAYERLAICYQAQGRLADAEALLRTARTHVPHRRCTFTDSLAVVLYLEGRKADALAELESVRADAPGELGASAETVLFHLGSLYAEMGRTADARAALEEYLRLSAKATDRTSIQSRTEARKTLGKLNG